MFKLLLPLLFCAAASVVKAQPVPPAGPVYDPQGRLIPHDGVRSDAEERSRAQPSPPPRKATKASKRRQKAEIPVASDKTAPKSGKTKAGSKNKAVGKKPKQAAKSSQAKSASTTPAKKKPARQRSKKGA